MKTTLDGAVQWITYIGNSVDFLTKSLVVNPSGTRVYACSYSTPIVVFEIDALTGSFTNIFSEPSETFSTNNYIQLHIADDGSSLYFPANSTGVFPGTALCKFPVSTQTGMN